MISADREIANGEHMPDELDASGLRSNHSSKLCYYVSIPLHLKTFDSTLSLHRLLSGLLSLQLHTIL